MLVPSSSVRRRVPVRQRDGTISRPPCRPASRPAPGHMQCPGCFAHRRPPAVHAVLRPGCDREFDKFDSLIRHRFLVECDERGTGTCDARLREPRSKSPTGSKIPRLNGAEWPPEKQLQDSHSEATGGSFIGRALPVESLSSVQCGDRNSGPSSGCAVSGQTAGLAGHQGQGPGVASCNRSVAAGEPPARRGNARTVVGVVRLRRAAVFASASLTT